MRRRYAFNPTTTFPCRVVGRFSKVSALETGGARLLSGLQGPSPTPQDAQSRPRRPRLLIPEEAAPDSGMMSPTRSEIIPPTVPR
jgi:hypothetical protein